MRRTRLTAAATSMVVLLAWTTCAIADVLEQVPSDALVVFKVNNLKSTSAKVSKLAQDLGVAAFAPQMADPLGFVQQQAKMTNGVNTEGDMAFVYLDPAQAGGDNDKSMLILIPVSDYQAFIGNWPDAQTDGAVSEVKMGNSPDSGFVSNWGSYAALSPTRDIVANKPGNLGIKFPAATSKELTSKDAILVANFKQLGPKLRPHVQQGREQAITELEQNMANDPEAAKFVPVARAAVGQFFNMADAFLAGTDAGAIGLSFTGEGILATVIADFKPDSYAGQLSAQAKNTADNKLAGLPVGKYMFFGGSTGDPQTATRVMDDLFQPIVTELVAADPKFKAAQDYYDGLKMYMSSTTSSSIGVMAPTAPGAEAMFQMFNVQRGDAEQMREGYKKMMTSQEQLMQALGVPAEQFKVTYTANAKTVEGVAFDALKTDFTVDPNDPSSGQAKMFMDMFYGPGGATVYLGVADGKMIQAMGLSDEKLTQAVAAAKGNLAPLSDLPTVKTVTANLPKNNLALFYVPVDEIVNTGLAYAKQFGFPVQVQLPPDLPPIGASFATEGSAMRFDVYVPSQLVQSLVAAGLQAANQFRGGGPGGGGGGL